MDGWFLALCLALFRAWPGAWLPPSVLKRASRPCPPLIYFFLSPAMCPLSKLVDQLSGVLAQTQNPSVRCSALLCALTVEAASSRDELSHYILRHPDAESAMLSILPHRTPHGIPTPPADAPSSESPEFKCRSEAPDAGGKTNSAKAPDTRYTSAEVAASKVLNEAFEPMAIAQLGSKLSQRRRQLPPNLTNVEEFVTCSLSENSSDQEIVKHLRCLQNLADAVTSNVDFALFTKRFWFARYVKLFTQMTSRKNSREKSLAVLFVEITMAQWVSRKEGLKEKQVDAQIKKEIEEKTKAGKEVEEVTAKERAARVRSELHKAKREIWKTVVFQHTFWLHIIDEFGCAALALIDERMSNTQ